MITPDEAFQRAIKLVESARVDARRRLITDLLMAGYGDDAIVAALEQNDESCADQGPELERQIVAGVRSASRELLGVEWTPARQSGGATRCL